MPDCLIPPNRTLTPPSILAMGLTFHLQIQSSLPINQYDTQPHLECRIDTLSLPNSAHVVDISSRLLVLPLISGLLTLCTMFLFLLIHNSEL